jgi:hypothetical protein
MPRLKYSITNQNQASQDGSNGRFGKSKLLFWVMQVFDIQNKKASKLHR